MKIALCVIATGKYTRFLCELLSTAQKFFCSGHDVRFFVFADTPHLLFLSPTHPGPLSHLTPARTSHGPGPTLHRYRTMLQAAEELLACDYVYYVDVDSAFRAAGGRGDLRRPGRPRSTLASSTSPATIDLRNTPISRAYVTPRQRREARHYYCGGFQGGRAGVYVEAMRAMDAAIADDERRGLTACWHDESHWNRYLIDHPPTVELSHDYMCPPPWRPETQRIVIVGKDNGEVRS